MKNHDNNSSMKYEESTLGYTNMLNQFLEKDKKKLYQYYQKFFPLIDKRLLNKKKNSIKILSVGCGIGYELTFFLKQGYTKLYGIDINKYSLKTAKKNCPLAFFSYGDIYQIPYRNSYFDLILLIEVIEHLDYPIKALQEVRRVLKSDGVLFLTTPNRMGLMGLSNGPIKFITKGYYYKSILRLLGLITCGPEHPREYFSFELSKILQRNGFNHITYPKYSYIPLFPAGKYYLITQKI